MTCFFESIPIRVNMIALMRSRGKIVPGSLREDHNVFTITGRNWLSKLISWNAIAADDVPYTQRRVRWVGVGTGSQLEVTTVSALANPVIARASPSQYLVPIDSLPTFPTSTSVEFAYEFATTEITTGGVPVAVSEAGLFTDVNPAETAHKGIDDVEFSPTVPTTLDPSTTNNPPIAYKAFEPLVKTFDFTLQIRWTFRF